MQIMKHIGSVEKIRKMLREIWQFFCLISCDIFMGNSPLVAIADRVAHPECSDAVSSSGCDTMISE
jgi:hypothetical protein